MQHFMLKFVSAGKL